MDSSAVIFFNWSVVVVDCHRHLEVGARLEVSDVQKDEINIQEQIPECSLVSTNAFLFLTSKPLL
jgi:hypothetical protein